MYGDGIERHFVVNPSHTGGGGLSQPLLRFFLDNFPKAKAIKTKFWLI